MVIQYRSFNEYTEQEPRYSNHYVSNRLIGVKFSPWGGREVDISRVCTMSELITKGKFS